MNVQEALRKWNEAADVDSLTRWEIVVVIDALTAQLAALTAERDRMREALAELMGWVDGWEPDFTDDDAWPETEKNVRAELDKDA